MMKQGRRRDKRKRLLARWGWLSLFSVVGVVIVIAAVSSRQSDAVPAAGSNVAGLTSVLSRKVGNSDSGIRFREVTTESGIRFRHMPVPRASLLPEDMGSGVACGDYDGDGRLDLFFVNFSGSVVHGAPLNADEGSARLYRNIDGERFEDVTAAAGVGFVGYGMGAAWGDYDNDGDLDLYVTAYGNNALYENLGDGTFQDVTDDRGVQDSRFSAGCSWGDYDRDGDLDLYVCNYVAFEYNERDRGQSQRQYTTEQPYTLNPSAYKPQPNALFRNRGDGSFDEVAETVGVADPQGRSLSAAWVDLDNDGWPDLYVANDVSNNSVFRNLGDGSFEDVGAESLAADYRGAMGIAVSDFDNDLDQDLLITHWIAQENALYRNMMLDSMLEDTGDGRLWFMDDADAYGLGQISLDMVGWATGFCDFDNDGLRDLWVINGSTLEQTDRHHFLRAQRPLLLWNRGDDGYVDVAATAAEVLGKPAVGRGGVQADFNGDGLMDLVLLHHGASPVVLKNVSPSPGNWLRVRLRQTGGNTAALGARAYVTTDTRVTADTRTQMLEVGCSSSYLSQNELTLHFGLGNTSIVQSLRIKWPDGCEEITDHVTLNREITISHEAHYPYRKTAQR